MRTNRKNNEIHECHCNVCTCENSENGFYTAVIDVVTKFGTVENLEEYDTCRYFNDKFVDSPEMALMVAADVDSKRWKAFDEVDVANILKDVVYDEKNNEYVLKRVYTSNWNEPTENQYKKFASGEYEFYVQTFYIQILKTQLIPHDLRRGAARTWIKKLETL